MTDPANAYHAYMRGWSAGASMKAMDPAFTKHSQAYMRENYEAGYKDGRVARSAASESASETTGYKPSILRVCEGDSS
jgi:hypothetical protein